MKTILVTTEELRENGIQTLTRIDDKYVEVVQADSNSTSVRRYYLNLSGTGHFYLDKVRYKIDDFMNVVPVQEDNTDRVQKEEIIIDFDMKKKVTATDESVRHYQYDTIRSCITSDIPVYLVGEAGTGKNFTLEEIAKDMNLEFYFTNSVQQEYKITGFIDAGGNFHETEFYKAFVYGGLFFLDEIDASIPEVLVLLNAAIANRYFEFPNGRVSAHKDFRVVAAGNTVGAGANELYTGRLVLDSATLDRFVIIEFDYDRNIELKIAQGNEQLVNFTRGLRSFCNRNGVRATFSYRMIMNVVKLEKAGLDLQQIMKIAVVKGLDTDTIKTLKTDYSEGSAGRYYYALKELQKAV